MSTVLEAAAAVALGMRVLGISCITNIAVNAKALAETSHQEVVDTANNASMELEKFLRALSQEL
jgi:purine-nucleoside phosphorylase